MCDALRLMFGRLLSKYYWNIESITITTIIIVTIIMIVTDENYDDNDDDANKNDDDWSTYIYSNSNENYDI